MKNWFYVYVLISLLDGMFYLGYTTNLRQRVIQHNNGLNVSTAKPRPLRLIYYEAHRSQEDAFRRESYFKTAKGKIMLRYIIRSSLRERQTQIAKLGTADGVYPSEASGIRQGSSVG
ncbi:MAG: GIY-YIG nuclease family protein [Patescibacteria group bacterium]|nr:GIY-YIG nuclease family protein [Patescibacteria group bacterium]